VKVLERTKKIGSSEACSRTLVLNAGYEPLSVVSFRRALALVMNGRAALIESDKSFPVRSPRAEWDRPSVIILTRYVKMPSSRRIPVSRRGVLRRDANRCAYCLRAASTVDHVLPRSRGGKDDWDNLVACCVQCNNSKGDKTPGEMGWKLRKAPCAPYATGWLVRGAELHRERWADYFPRAA